MSIKLTRKMRMKMMKLNMESISLPTIPMMNFKNSLEQSLLLKREICKRVQGREENKPTQR